ncbi:restriction endonuclease subunit S [Vibrio parahaemolyticus]|uniref:restriction endonuclease subunit S n=1 Tax=Vibrio parahaemolyticus TaxID=670 RepID=UPI0011238DA6|nr:restriction endonuclease subunit S [Vibrio parahaemolyticus]TOO76753.1 restriction endonuclease [Vibrio parahaemolyticus]
MAVENLITEHIDIWTSAVKTKSTSGRGSSKKLELYGIKKLRKLILELAVHGKLVPQDPNDEPADILVQRIMAKKKELLADGTFKKTKKSKVHDAIISAEELPLGWVAADFGDITFNLDAQRIPLSVSERKGRQGIYDYYGASGVIDSIDAYLFDKPLLLIGEDGANLVNRSTPIAFMARGKYWVNNHAHVIDGISEDFLIYLSLYINSISLIPYITGMAQPKMNQAKMNSILVLLPPEKEQHRIVAKVDELMTLCDQLEQQTEASIEAHQVLLTTLLDTLTNSADADELMQNWARISEHFDTLFTTEESIDQLKQTILQLAVMGKLVPQDPSDEPATELLKRIAEEKAQLVKEKKIKKQKALPPISEDEKPFELPSGWEWCHLNSLISEMDAGWSPACPPEASPNHETWGVLKTTAVQSMEYREYENKVLSSSKEPRPQYEVKNGDILITRAGPKNRVGVSCLVQTTRPKLMISDKIIRFHLIELGMSNNFVSLCLNAGATSEYLESSKSGMAESQMNISQDKLKMAPIPLPPIREQTLIVKKVEELIDLCDKLKLSLEKGKHAHFQFTDSVIEQAV